MDWEDYATTDEEDSNSDDGADSEKDESRDVIDALANLRVDKAE